MQLLIKQKGVYTYFLIANHLFKNPNPPNFYYEYIPTVSKLHHLVKNQKAT